MKSAALVSFLLISGLSGTARSEDPSRREAETAPRRTGRVIEEFEVAREGDLLLLPVRIGDAEHLFVVDSGAASSVVDVSFEDLLTRPPQGSPRRRKGVELYRLPNASVGESRFPVNGNIACVDLSHLRKYSGFDVRGILGADFLNDHVIRIDFDAGRLAFLSAPEANPGAAVSMARDDDQRPEVEVKLFGETSFPFLIDTGMAVRGLGEIRPGMFDLLDDAGRLSKFRNPARSLVISGKSVESRKAQLDQFQFAGFEHSRIGVHEGALNALGLDYLSRFRVTFDFPGKTLYLRKGRLFDRPTDYDMSGLSIARVGGRTIVQRIRSGGPARDLGLAAGDVIIAVDGEPAETYTLFELRQILASEGEHVRLRVERDGLRRDLEFELTNWQRHERQQD